MTRLATDREAEQRSRHVKLAEDVTAENRNRTIVKSAEDRNETERLSSTYTSRKICGRDRNANATEWTRPRVVRSLSQLNYIKTGFFESSTGNLLRFLRSTVYRLQHPYL